MTTAWRLVKQTRARHAFSGEGARIYGGRWNLPGTRVVYLSGSLALAALEMFVHLGKAHASLRFKCFRVTIPGGLKMESVRSGGLPPAWRQEPPPSATQRLGTDWVEAGTSCVLKVPSVIVPVEDNLMLNPDHRDFAKLVIEAPEPFGFDPRMWK